MTPEQTPLQLAYGQVTDWSIAYDDPGRWHNVALSCEEAKAMLNTGMLDSRIVRACKILFVSDADRPEIGASWLVYDFTLAKSGQPAWRLQHEPAA